MSWRRLLLYNLGHLRLGFSFGRDLLLRRRGVLFYGRRRLCEDRFFLFHHYHPGVDRNNPGITSLYAPLGAPIEEKEKEMQP
jgi:hypothetical protein